MNRLRILCGSTPDNPQYGYGDHFEYYIGGECVMGGHASACPNPYKASTGESWESCYGWLDNGEYDSTIVDHLKYGVCMVLREGGACASRTPNPNHDGKYILTEVMVHQGGFECENPNWRGSAGCITIANAEWEEFTTHLIVGDSVLVEVLPLMENQPVVGGWWSRWKRLLAKHLPSFGSPRMT